MAQEAGEWINIALICEKLHVLPLPGGVFDQDEQHISRLLHLYDLLDKWREEEMKKSSNASSVEPNTSTRMKPST